MNNNQPDISPQPKSNRVRNWFVIGLIFTLLIGSIMPAVWRARTADGRHFQDILQFFSFAIGSVGLVVLVLSLLFRKIFRRLFRRELLPRYLFAFACFSTLIAAFYAVENWRGKRAWEKTRHQFEAKGAVLNWNAYIPPPVPDEQNFYKAPNMSNWFVKPLLRQNSTNHTLLSNRLGFNRFNEERAVATITVIPTARQLPSTGVDVVLKWDDSKHLIATDQRGEDLLRDRLITLTDRKRSEPIKEITPSLTAAQNFSLVREVPAQFQPLRIYLKSDTIPSLKELGEFLPTAGGAILEIKSSDTNLFKVSSNRSSYPIIAADEYLKWSDEFQIELDSIREALHRPHARIDDDYERPFTHSIPNFISIRAVAQMLAQRAQCYLLLNEPDKAWRELTFMHELRGLLEKKVHPTLVVSAMINVAVAGIYESVIADGFRLQAWEEPHIDAISQQLGSFDLLSPLEESLKTERAAATSTLENATSDQIDELFFPPPGAEKNSVWRKLKNPVWLLVKFAPRGWVYQNLASMLSLPHWYIESLDQNANTSMPRRINGAKTANDPLSANTTPYNFIAHLTMPNFNRAFETAARNQTTARLGVIVCAMEKYRLAQNSYPETLETLVPHYLKEIPHEIINGEPLKYRRTDDGKFLLYSVGWDEKDDGGVTSTKPNEPTDWVWPSL